MALSYRQVRDLYDQLKASGATSVSLPEWSERMNALTGTDLYTEGQSDNFVKRSSVAIDKALEWTGIPTATAELGRGVGSLVGNPEAGAVIGHGLPRMTLNFAPLAASALFPPAAPFALAATGALSGAEAYTNTGSPASGLVTAGINMAMPGVANAAEQFVLKKMGVESLGQITSRLGMNNGLITDLATKAAPLVAETAAQRVAAFGGGQVAAAGLMEGQRWGEEYFSGQPLHNPFSTENLLNYTLGQLPFALTHGVTKLAGHDTAKQMREQVEITEKRMEQKRAQEALREQTDLEKIPIIPTVYTAEQQEEISTRISVLRAKQEAITSKVSQTPEDAQQLNDAVAADLATPKIPTATSVLGAEQRSEHVGVAGTQIHETAKWRKILVADDPANPEELRGKVVEYSKGLREPAPTPIGDTGMMSFGVTADPLWRTIKTQEEEAARQAKYVRAKPAVAGERGAGTPELPAQAEPASRLFLAKEDLASLDVQLEAARTPAELQKVLLELQRVQESVEKEPFNDLRLARVVKKLEKANAKDPVKKAIKSEMAKARRQMDAEEEALKRKAVREDTASETIGENTGTKNNAPLPSLPKLNDDTEAIHNFVDEVISGAQVEKDAVESFELWRKATKTKDTTSISLEKDRFKIYWKLMQSGEIGNEEVLSPSDARVFNDELKAQSIGVEDPTILHDFPERDHVLNWNDAVNEKLVEGQAAHAPQPQQIMPEGNDPKAYLPALKIDGVEVVGQLGDTHQDIIKRHFGDDLDSFQLAMADFDSKANPNYFKKGDEVISRDQLKAELGVRDSQRLRDLQGKPSPAPRVPPTPYVSDVPAQQDIISRFTTDGHGVVKELLTDLDPQVRAIAADLAARFPEALSRIDSGIYDIPGSRAQRRVQNFTGLFFDRSFLNASSSVRNNIALHELIHGLTLYEISSGRGDPKLLKELTALRERLITSLPKKMQAKYQELIDSDWYERYSQGKGFWEELHIEGVNESQARAQAQVLYALLNNEELASMGFSSREVQSYMRSVKGEARGKSLWNTFTNWVKGLTDLHKIDETAFGDFLSITNGMISHGEFMSDFGNFGERYFEGQGKDLSYARRQTDRALGIVADSAQGLSEPLTIAQSLDFTSLQSRANRELTRARRDYENLRKNSVEDAAHIDSVLAELGHKDLDTLVTSAIGEGENISDALLLLPPEATRYVYEKLRDSHDVLDVIRAASAEQNKGLVNLANPKLLRESITPLLKQIKQALKHEELEQYMGEQLAGLSGVEPSGLLDSMPAMAPKVLEEFFDKAKGTVDTAFENLSHFIEPNTQWARRVPEVAEAISKGRQLASNTRKMFHEGVKWFGMDTSSPYADVFTYESVEQTNRVMSSPKLRNKVGQWMYWNQEKAKQEGRGVTTLAENDADVAKLLGGLNDSEKQDVRDLVGKASKVTQMMNAQKLEKMTQIASTNGAGVIAYATGLKTRDNVALSSQLLSGIQKMADPMTSQDGMVMVQNVQQRMQPEAFITLYDFLKGEADNLALWKQYFDANPAWATAQRTERYLIKARDKNGKPKKLQASSHKEADDIIAKTGYKLDEPYIDQWKGKEDQPFAFPDMSPKMIQRMQEIQENQISIMKKAGAIDAAGEQAYRESSLVDQIVKEASANNKIPGVNAPPRKLSQGADELPWLYNHLSWAEKESNYWSRALLRAQQRTYLKDIEIRDIPEHVERLQTHFENLLRNDPAVAQKINRFASTWFLGFNPATVLINAAQPFTSHVSELTALNGGKMLDSYRRVTRALDEAKNLKFGRNAFASEEHRWLHEQATKDGQIGLGKYDDDAAAQETLAYRFKRAMKKEAPKTLGQRLGTLADNYSTVGMWLFKGGEQLNSEAALFASYDLYREQGLSREDAKQKAYEFNGVVNYNEGRNQRGTGAFSSKSPTLRGAAMLGTSLQSYVIGTTSQIIRYLQQGFFRPAGLTPSEIHAARKAAVQMLATQLAAAGVLGMPFVSGALALLDKAFPELELNRKTREMMDSFLSGDEENGSVLTDIAMTGLPSALGWDMQSRLSMGNTLPGVSEVNGFQPENLMGPTANIVRNFVNGVTGFVKGDPKSASSFLPPPVRKLIEAGQASLSSGQEGGGIRDYQGRPLAQPTRGEYAGAWLGFQPARLSQQNSAARILKQSEEVLRTQESRFRSQLAEEALKGNFGNIRQELRAKKAQQQDYDDVAAVQAIARAAEELKFPRDLRREGTSQGAQVRGSVLATYGQVGQASEVERLKFRKEIEQRLGLVGDIKQELKLAILMDQLKVQNPKATRMELKASALEASRRVLRQRQLSPLEFQ